MGLNTMLVCAVMSTPPADTIGALEILLRLRWAEALLAAREAEGEIAEYASHEAQVAAAEDKA